MALPMQRRGSTSEASSPRLVNVALGLWLFISAFIWPRLARADRPIRGSAACSASPLPSWEWACPGRVT